MKCQKAPFDCDMHCHTNRSDGNDTPEELVAAARACGVRVLVLCDHDVLPPQVIGGMPAAPYAAGQGLVLLPGIEFSCDTELEDVHIVGIGCDFAAPAFADYVESVKHTKVKAYRELVEMLAEDGMDICWEDVLQRPEGRIRQEDIQRKHVFEAMARQGIAPTWREAKMMVQQTPRYAAIQREKIDPKDALAMIHETGGVSILAHPYLIREEARGMSRARYIDELIAAGLMAIEASYPYEKTSYAGPLSSEQIEAKVRRDYGERLYISGGSDYHADGKKGVENPRAVGEKGLSMEEFFAFHPAYKLALTMVPGAQELLHEER